MKHSNRADHARRGADRGIELNSTPPAIQVGWGGLADTPIEGHGRPPAMTAHTPNPSGGPSRRTQFVLAVFAVGMTVVMGLLAIDTPRPAGGFPLTKITTFDDRPESADDLLFSAGETLDRDRWSGIVIHHLGEPFGTPESIHRQHLSWGYQGLGYHFLVGNGNGLANGEIHVGYRWIEQLPGAHVVGEAGKTHNEHSIGICLIGNGDKQPYSERQIRHLVRLVQRLQQECGIPADAVHLHADLASGLTSPGHLFPEADFRAQLLDAPH